MGWLGSTCSFQAENLSGSAIEFLLGSKRVLFAKGDESTKATFFTAIQVSMLKR
jgi:hypothetical protein